MEDRLSISFSGEASEGFADRVSKMKDWYVRITPQEGEPFDAVILDAGTHDNEHGLGWYDEVRYVRASEDTGLPIEGAQPESVRVIDDVYVY